MLTPQHYKYFQLYSRQIFPEDPSNYPAFLANHSVAMQELDLDHVSAVSGICPVKAKRIGSNEQSNIDLFTNRQLQL